MVLIRGFRIVKCSLSIYRRGKSVHGSLDILACFLWPFSKHRNTIAFTSKVENKHSHLTREKRVNKGDFSILSCTMLAPLYMWANRKIDSVDSEKGGETIFVADGYTLSM